MNRFLVFLVICLILAVLASSRMSPGGRAKPPEPAKEAQKTTLTPQDLIALKVLPKVQTVSSGQVVDLEQCAVKGGVTIFDFYADWCGPCQQMAPHVEALVEQHDRVFLRKINIEDWGSPVAKQHHIRSIPALWVYGKDGKLFKKPGSDFQALQLALEEALKN